MNFLLILKGIIVGIAKVMPGISGSMLAMSLGIYENIINAITNFFSNPKKNIILLFNFGLGCFIAIILFSRLLIFLLNNYYYETIYLFLGLIIGTLINFTKELKFSRKNIFIFIIFLILTLLLSNLKTNNVFIFKGTFLNYIYTSFLGFIDATTSIIPGISGTVIYMLLGSYEYVLSLLANPFSLSFIFYLIGLFLGIIIICYLMMILLKYKKEETYMIIFSFMIGSLIILLFNIINSFSLGLLLFLIFGLFIGSKLKN